MRRSQQALSPILELNQALAAGVSLNDLYRQALAIVRRELGVERAALMLVRGPDLVTAAGEELPPVRIPGDVVEQLTTSTQAFPLDAGAAPWAGSLLEALPGPAWAQPLTVAKRLIGLLIVGREQIPPDQMDLLAILGGQVAGAVERNRLFREGLRHVTDLNTVNEIGQLLSTVLEQGLLLALLHQQVGRVLDASNFYVALYNEAAQQLHFPFCRDAGLPLAEPPRPFDTGEHAGKTEYVIRTGEPYLSQWDTLGLLPICELRNSPHTPRSFLGIPLLRGDRVLGMMAVQDYEREYTYDEDDLNLLATVAAQTAAALENARLFQERERRIIELSVLNEMSRALSSTLELDDLLMRVYQQVSRLFDTTNFYIATYAGGSDEWTTVLDLEHGESQPRARYHVGAGITGHIIRTRQPVLLRTDQEGLAFDEEQGLPSLGPRSKCWMGVPLIAADKVMGVMAIQSYDEEDLYDEQDLALFSTIATPIAVTIENLRLLQETRRRAQELEAINEVGQTITSTLDLDAVLRRIVDTTKSRFGYYFVNISLSEGDHLAFLEGSTIGDSNTRLERRGHTFDLQPPSLIAEAARTGQPVLVNDVLSDPRYLAIPELAATRSELSMPIEVKGQIIGVLDVQSEQPSTYGPADVTLLQSLASQAGIAIENARLFQKQERRIAELAILNEISQAVSSTLKLNDLLTAICQKVSHLFDTTNFYIALYYADTDEWASPLHLEHGQPQPVVRRKVQLGFTGYIIRNCQPLLLRSVAENRAFKEAQGIATIGEQARSWMGVPLVAADKVVGVMAIQNYEQEYVYSESDLSLFMTIAAQAGIAIENARLFQEAQRLAATVQELSAPVIEVWDDVLVLPLVGGMDETRSHRITESLLDGITQHRAQVVIIDVTGVPLIDSQVADHLLATAQAAELLGARCVLTGISPEIAQTIVSLGLPLTRLTTLPNLQAGIRYALALLRRAR